MSGWLLIGAAVLAMAVVTAGCGPKRVQKPLEKKRPVVAMAPVETRPFEDGYSAGFELGKQQGVPRGKMPPQDEVERLGREQASGHAERTARWERGFVEGYLDGFRNVVTGQK